MLEKFFNRAEKASAPEGKRVYAIGDIHGRIDLLEELLARIHDDNGGNADQLVFLGDYVDRGPDSKGVIDRLTALGNSDQEVIFLKGNHEAIMLDFLNDPSEKLHWLEWGGEETLESYGVENVLGRSGEDLAAELAKQLPAEHKLFLESLRLTHLEGDYLFVHAGVRPGVPLEDQQEEDLLWIRKRFHKASSKERPDKVVIHGHQPTKKPIDAGWRIGIDTGACWTGRLTAVVLEGTKRRFLSTGNN